MLVFILSWPVCDAKGAVRCWLLEVMEQPPQYVYDVLLAIHSVVSLVDPLRNSMKIVSHSSFDLGYEAEHHEPFVALFEHCCNSFCSSTIWNWAILSTKGAAIKKKAACSGWDELIKSGSWNHALVKEWGSYYRAAAAWVRSVYAPTEQHPWSDPFSLPGSPFLRSIWPGEALYIFNIIHSNSIIIALIVSTFQSLIFNPGESHSFFIQESCNATVNSLRHYIPS